MTKRRFWSAICLVCLGLIIAQPVKAQNKDLLIFAAASTTNAVAEAGQTFEGLTGIKVVNSFASSSTLAKQIAQGAPAHVYISANVKWMDYLEKKMAIVPASRFNLLRNRLALIAPAAGPKINVSLAKPAELPNRLGDSRLAMGNPDHVPAGIYAKQALVSLGFWEGIKDKIAAAATVRAALALVARGEATLGIVYATDAAITDQVRVVELFPVDSHRPIVYPAARVKGGNHPAAGRYLEFLKSYQAMAIFKKYGFQPYK